MHHPRLLVLRTAVLPVECRLHLQNAAYVPCRHGVRRDRLDVAGSFEDNSRTNAGPMHSLATDGKGDIYLGRSGGGPGYVQRFSPKSTR